MLFSHILFVSYFILLLSEDSNILHKSAIKVIKTRDKHICENEGIAFNRNY